MEKTADDLKAFVETDEFLNAVSEQSPELPMLSTKFELDKKTLLAAINDFLSAMPHYHLGEMVVEELTKDGMGEKREWVTMKFKFRDHLFSQARVDGTFSMPPDDFKSLAEKSVSGFFTKRVKTLIMEKAYFYSGTFEFAFKIQ